MSRGHWLIILFTPAFVFALGQESDRWALADAAVVRLTPSAFPHLPAAIRKALERGGCTIPQTYLAGKPHNVIQGEFARKGQKDWAALCSKDRKSALKVFWGGSARCVEPFPPVEDRLSLQGIGDKDIGFSTQISPADPNSILRYHREYGGAKPPTLTHQGIESSFVGKASVVFYCHEGKWLHLSGAD